MLQIVFPALFQADEFLDLLGQARLPKLDRLLARGRREPLAGASLEGLLCHELGIARQQDWPTAPISLAQAGGHPAGDYWLRADPVHVRIERDRLILTEIPEPAADEAKMLCDALAAHFGESFSPQALRPGAWVVRAAGTPAVATTPLSQAAGRHIDPLLPSGDDALHWRKLLNEIQMLLFSHPVNAARELRGELAINSVWLWGGGCLPKAGENPGRTVFSDNADWRAMAEFTGAKTSTLPDRWQPSLSQNALVVFDEPHRHLRRDDFAAWLQAMQHFENDWLAPLLAAGLPFRLDDPLAESSLVWRSAYRWKFWRRPGKPTPQGFNIHQPAADPGVDAFGNRY